MKHKIILLMLFVTLVSCEQDQKFSTHEYPLVFIKSIKPDNDGALFTAEIPVEGNYRIEDYGFYWGEDRKRYSVSLRYEENSSKVYSHKVTADLEPGRTYICYPYLKSNGITIRGEGKKFLSKGSQPYYLKEISPKKGGEGTKCTIKGNLSYWENNTDVFIGNKKMEKLFHSHDSIVFQIPRVNNFGSQPVTLRTHYPEEIILADGLMFELVEP